MAKRYRRKDKHYEQAKASGYRSRAAFKLKELQKKYRVLKKGDAVLDLGAWPGGWLQVAAEVTGTAGIVVGIDTAAIDPIDAPNIIFFQGSADDDEVLDQARSRVNGYFDVVLSDMAPKLTGIKEADEANTVECAQMAVHAASRVLRPGGGWVVKVFPNQETEQFVKSVRPLFNTVARTSLESTRSSSRETYLVGRGFKAAGEADPE